MLCRRCGGIISETHGEVEYHPIGCWPDHEPLPETGVTPFDMEVKEEIRQIVSWADRNSARSQQVALGCSEVGHECDRRLAYRMANVEPVTRVGFGDSWPAIVGTAIHAWVEKAVNGFQASEGVSDWMTETAVQPNEILLGHCDLYSRSRRLVVDLKTKSPDNMKKFKKEGPEQQHKVQVNLYAKGIINLGYPVDRVGIVALPRSGWLRDALVWTEPYDPNVLPWAMQRLQNIAALHEQLGVEGNPAAWNDIPAAPSRNCGFCPWYQREAILGATDKGCPGL